MVLWSHLLSFFCLMCISDCTNAFSTSRSFSNANWGTHSKHWMSFLDKLHSFFLWFLFFSEIVNVMTPVRADSFRGFFSEQSIEPLNYTTWGGKKFIRNVFIHSITISLLLFLSWKKSFILVYKFCPKFFFIALVSMWDLGVSSIVLSCASQT